MMGTSSAVENRCKKVAVYSRLKLFNDNGYFQNDESYGALDKKSLNSPGNHIYSLGYSDWNRQYTSDPSKSLSKNFTQLKSDQNGESK